MGNKIEKMACPYCGNDNINEMIFDSIDYVDPRHKQNPMLGGYTYEWKPKIPIGFHFKCTKCNKDTFIIPENGAFGNIEWGEDIPAQTIFTPVFKQPEYSATTYIMYNGVRNGGYLDQVVVTNKNTILSLITRETVVDDGTWKIIDEKMYKILKSQGIKEVGVYEQSYDVNVDESFRSTGTANDGEVAKYESTGTTKGNGKGERFKP